MAKYQMFLDDNKATNPARQEVTADSEAHALTLRSLLWKACLKWCCGYEPWSFNRRIALAPDEIGILLPLTFEGISRAMQDRVLDLEDKLRRSRWRVTESG
jgi:hypothetical protein